LRERKAPADVGNEALRCKAGSNIEMAHGLIAKPLTLWPIMR
jgi:hypothetical protein